MSNLAVDISPEEMKRYHIFRKNKYELVLFSLDETLALNTTEVYTDAVYKVLHKLGLEEYTLKDCRRLFHGTSILDIRRYLCDKHPKAKYKQVTAELVTKYALASKHFKNLVAGGGADALLTLFELSRHKGELKACVFSNMPKQLSIAILEKVGLGKFFPEERIFGPERVSQSAPNGSSLLIAMHAMGVHLVTDCAVVASEYIAISACISSTMDTFIFLPNSMRPPCEVRFRHQPTVEYFINGDVIEQNVKVKAEVKDLYDLRQYFYQYPKNCEYSSYELYTTNE